MNADEAVKYCEDHECEECIIFTENLDRRTIHEKCSHIPCCLNLLDGDTYRLMVNKFLK